MAQAAWEKPQSIGAPGTLQKQQGSRWKFLVGGLLILGAVAYLIVSGTLSGAQYFMTVDELMSNPEYIGKTVRISGAVIGETIDYDDENLIINFTIANVPNEYQDLAQALHTAVGDSNAARIPIVVENQVKPDLLQHEAQAILTGTLGTDGVFRATELLLKCPTRFEDANHGQEITDSGT
ncbi:MAG: cytochrome c maturation protein CcmE [Anaerolineae bacterium]|nr:cytochrome c maturation protein CcmE [Anaerolineae bacterium]